MSHPKTARGKGVGVGRIVLIRNGRVLRSAPDGKKCWTDSRKSKTILPEDSAAALPPKG